MRRIILLIVCFVFACLSFGQTIDYQTNAPRCGDLVKRHKVDYFSSVADGKDALWDFSELQILDEKEDIEYFLGKDSVLRSADSERMCFYSLSEDSLILTGYDSPLERMIYTEPIPLMTYPFSYGYAMSNVYEGTGSYCQRQIIKHKGTHYVEAEAEGAIINAEGDTIPDVIKIHTVRTGSVCFYLPSDSLFEDSTYIKQQIQDINQWYARGYRYPLYETVSTAYYDNLTMISNILSAYTYSTEEQDLLDDDVNEEVRKEMEREKRKDIDIIHYNVTNNGSSITIDYSLDADASINALICNSRGMVYSRQNQRKSVGEGYSISFSISSLPRGNYVLYMNVNGKVYNEKIEKRF